jgi:ABC-type polysaccharide/polyol phosphate export permease
MLRELVKRDLQSRYAGSLLGFFWSFVQPLWLLSLYWFVFGRVMKVSLAGERAPGFALFLFAGLLPWLAINEGLTRSATAITDHAHLVKKLRFPSELLVASCVLAALVHEVIAAGVFTLVLGVLGVLAWPSLPWLVVAVLLQVLLTVGLGLILASLHVFLRDIVQAMGMVLGAWFYLTPIVYPTAYVPARFLPVIEANPLSALVAMYRRAFFGGSGCVAGSLVLVASAALLLVAGALLFRRLRPAFVDFV